MTDNPTLEFARLNRLMDYLTLLMTVLLIVRAATALLGAPNPGVNFFIAALATIAMCVAVIVRAGRKPVAKPGLGVYVIHAGASFVALVSQSMWCIDLVNWFTN